MPTYTAAAVTDPSCLAGELCDVTVTEDDDEGNLTDKIVFGPAETEVSITHEDVLGVIEDDAERVLGEHGWHVTGPWEVADNCLYAPVERDEEA